MVFNRFFFMRYFLGISFAAPGDGGGGAPPPEPTPEDIKAERDALKAELEKLKAAPPPKPDPEKDPDLLERSRKAALAAAGDKNKIREIEKALTFNMSSANFLKQNAGLLPSDVSEVFAQAEKETFDDASEKAAQIKSGVIQSFFAVQANVDLLTPGQKASLDDFNALTKNGKLEKAQTIYELIFEPAFETLKRVKKAESLSKGLGSGDDDAYKKKLMAGSTQHYLGEKKNA